MKMIPRNEVHICHSDVGHKNAVDCWCEPSRIYWYRNLFGIDVLVVEHNDDVNIHRFVRTAARERDKFILWAANAQYGIDEPWITRALDLIVPDLPPDPNERSV